MDIKLRFLLLTIISVSLSLGLTSCKQDACDQVDERPSLAENIKVNRLEEELKKFESVEDVISFLDENRMAADFFLDAGQYPNDTILATRMFRLFSQPSIDTLIDESVAYFGDFNEVTAELEGAYQFIKQQYPEAKIPKLQTIVTGLYNDMYVSDSLIVVGLDYFMGVNGRYFPDIPFYIVQRYKKESLTPFVLSFISNQYNQIDNKNNTLLADMINLGKSYYFVSQALPCKEDSLIIGYSSEEMKLVRENQEIIWANLIQNELLYTTEHHLKNKFVGESPNIAEISEKCPGRVGAWLGWEIVRRYMDKNPEVTFAQLMSETDSHKIFQHSGYRPRNQN